MLRRAPAQAATARIIRRDRTVTGFRQKVRIEWLPVPSNKPESVVIIGAGVTGLSTAFHLVEKGVESVTVIDKGTVGGGSSLQSGGIITMLMATVTEVRARAIALDIFERFSGILDGYHFHQVGCLNLFTEEVFSQNAALREMWLRNGGQFDILRGAEISDRFPDLEAADSDYGILDHRSGFSEPHHYVAALKAKLEEMGVDIRENESVIGFEVRGDRVREVVTVAGSIDVPAYEMNGPEFHIGELQPHPDALPFIEENLIERTSLLEGAEWDYHTVGLISLAHDVKPVIGPVPGVDGLYVGAHFHSGGFAYNPVSGLMLAEHVVDGGTSIDTEMYNPARFGSIDTEAFLSSPVMHSEMGITRH
ncbi:MAG: FAD-binding oxidoreductase [Chloroflexi bacterium]|nr:FAD-binding oxidoreductase [Chloroflexota bacterium]MYF80108.1 FAD-binding oxidoreductase [Chloroflexota bacterium]MYK62317.1 FAD-binding oxidoreductase [Chloroflexota bacterium]